MTIDTICKVSVVHFTNIFLVYSFIVEHSLYFVILLNKLNGSPEACGRTRGNLHIWVATPHNFATPCKDTTNSIQISLKIRDQTTKPVIVGAGRVCRDWTQGFVGPLSVLDWGNPKCVDLAICFSLSRTIIKHQLNDKTWKCIKPNQIALLSTGDPIYCSNTSQTKYSEPLKLVLSELVWNILIWPGRKRG